MALNPRLFTSGHLPSERAARAWMGGAPPLAGARNLLLEDVDPSSGALLDATPGVQGVTSGARRWLTGSTEALRRPLAATPALRPALDALEAFEAALASPPTPLVMGILNVTPDSFSDGGRFASVEAAVDAGLDLLAAGADVVDIGGESTRPGAAEVPPEVELARVLPVVRELRRRTDAPLSIDTRKAAVAEPCLNEGADWVNDVSGLAFDPSLANLVAEGPNRRLVLMHSRARPETERYSTDWTAAGAPVYEDVVADTLRWLRSQCELARSRGVQPGQLWIDPGFGFGKTFEQNVDLLRRLREYTSAGYPVLIGTSRKSTVGRLLGDAPAAERLEGTAATVAWSIGQGAAAVRVHDVRAMARVARVSAALAGPDGSGSPASPAAAQVP